MRRSDFFIFSSFFTAMKLHHITLSPAQKSVLRDILHKGKHSASARNRAQCLFLSDKGLPDGAVADILEMSPRSIAGIRARFCERGLEETVYGLPRPGRPPSFDAKDEAELSALACSAPPEGHSRWTLALLQERMSKTFGQTTIHVMLKKTESSRGATRCGASARSTSNTDTECTS